MLVVVDVRSFSELSYLDGIPDRCRFRRAEYRVNHTRDQDWLKVLLPLARGCLLGEIGGGCSSNFRLMISVASCLPSEVIGRKVHTAFNSHRLIMLSHIHGETFLYMGTDRDENHKEAKYR